MKRHDGGFGIRLRQGNWLLGWWAALLIAAAPAPAMTRVDIFQATVPLANRSEAAHTAAFQEAMRAVLVRVTGRRGAETDPALAALVGGARRYVQQYRASATGGVVVVFDGAAIDRWLTQNSQPVWGSQRPSTFVWLTIAGGPQAGTLVTAEDGSELKATIDEAAAARGIPLRWPSATELQAAHLDGAAVSAASPATLADLAHRFGADGVLIGHAGAATAAATVRWVHLFADHSGDYSGAQDGVNRAADLYASMFAASGSNAPVDIEIEGIAALGDYAQVQTYLETLSGVSRVAVLALDGDSMRFRLTTRGGVAPLERALTLGARLQPVTGGEDAIRRYRWRR